MNVFAKTSYGIFMKLLNISVRSDEEAGQVSNVHHSGW